MKSKFIFSILLFISILLSYWQSSVHGERSEKSPNAPQLLFRTIGVGVNASDLFYIDKDKPKPISIDTERRSQYFDYSSRPAPLNFVRLANTPEGKEQRIPIAQAQIEPSLRRALLIFMPADQTSEKLNVIVLKEDASAIPAGGYRVLNFLPVNIEVAAGINKQLASPGSAIVLTPQPAPLMSVYEFRVFGIISESKAPVTLYSNVYTPDKNVRYLVLVLPSPSSPNQINVKILEESVNSIRPDDPEPQPLAHYNKTP
jgi:hypothetical protein